MQGMNNNKNLLIYNEKVMKILQIINDKKQR